MSPPAPLDQTTPFWRASAQRSRLPQDDTDDSRRAMQTYGAKLADEQEC